MFRENPAPQPHSPAICFVGPIKTPAASALEAKGWRVHVLESGRAGGVSPRIQKPAAPESESGGLYPPLANDMALPGPHSSAWLDRLDQVRLTLADLNRIHHFDIIQFDDDEGMAYRTIQSKRLGLDFRDALLAVNCQQPGQQHRALRQEWSQHPEDLARDFAERFAFENADVPMVADEVRPVLQYLGWEVKPGAKWLNRNNDVDAFYRSLLTKPLPVSGVASPMVTVAVAYYNLAPFLEETLASLAGQTYSPLEVLVIDDGSTEPEAAQVFEECQSRYPQFAFHRQSNAGIGATRNRGLELAQGKYFLPMDADNIARPDMVERFVAGLERQPGVAVLTCYFLAFRQYADLERKNYAYAYKPIGGPRVLGCLQNIYGDGNALFRTQALRDLGGFTTDRDASWEDWETFVRLENFGHRVEVMPEVLFYYRHRDDGFSRVTQAYRNHQRILRPFLENDHLPKSERLALWNILAGQHLKLQRLENKHQALQVQFQALRYQILDGLHSLLQQIPWLRLALNWLRNKRIQP